MFEIFPTRNFYPKLFHARTIHASYSTLIVGAGVFGLSTALHLARKHPNGKIKLVDKAFPNRAAASFDRQRVVRADYTNILYMDKTLEALKLWRTDPLYRQFYHQSGLVWVDDKGIAETILENYKRLGADEKVRLANAAEVRKLYRGIFANAKIEDDAEILINESSGWIDAAKCLEATRITALEHGVECIEADVSGLAFDSSGSCTGVRTEDQQLITADRTLLAVGAQTAKVLVDSDPDRAELHAGDRLIAAAITTAKIRFTSEEAERFRDAPLFFHYGTGNTHGELTNSHLLFLILNVRNRSRLSIEPRK
jgi:sarcosine oxidase/L-pipecolate oxidase